MRGVGGATDALDARRLLGRTLIFDAVDAVDTFLPRAPAAPGVSPVELGLAVLREALLTADTGRFSLLADGGCSSLGESLLRWL